MTFTLSNEEYDSIDDFMEAYFEQKAVELLEHSKARPSYFVNSDVESAKEIKDAIQGDLQLPALILDYNDDDLASPSDRLTNRIYGAVTVINTFDSGNGSDLRRVRKDCRKLALQVIKAMLRDSYQAQNGVLICNKIFVQKNLFNGIRIGVVLGEFTGWCYEFSWEISEQL